jgi:trigger factor
MSGVKKNEKRKDDIIMQNTKVTIEAVDSVKQKWTVEVPSEEVKAEVDIAYEKLAKTANIAGFRQGKIPRDVLMQKFEGRVLSDAATAIIEKSFPAALKERKVMPIARPDFEVKRLEEGKSLIYTGTIETVPEVDVKNYKNMEIERKSTEVTEEELEENFIKLCDAHAEFKPVEREAEEGDMAMIDFQGFMNGKPIKDGEAKDAAVVVGDNLLPGFDDVLEGAKAGDEFTVKTKFPEKYHIKDLKGKEAEFKVQVKGVRVRVVPPFDDELAKLLGADNIGALKKKIVEEAKSSKEFNEKERLRGEAVDRLISENPFDIPPSMKKKYYDGVLKTVENMSKEEQGGFKKPEMTPDLNARYQQVAELHAKRDLIVEAIAKKENLEASDQEVEDAVEKIAKQAGEDLDRMMARIQREGSLDSIKTGIRHEKVFDLMIGEEKVAKS